MGWKDGLTSLQGAAQAVFGGEVSYEPKGGTPFDVRFVHYRAEGYEDDLHPAEQPVIDSRPEMHFRLVPNAPTGLGGRNPIEGDMIEMADGARFHVTGDVVPDGEGIVVCHLYYEDSSH